MTKRSGSQPLDMEKVKRVGDLFRRGWTTKQVRAEFGISTAAACEYRRISGHADRSNLRRSAITLEDVANVRFLRANGVTWELIGAQLGFNKKALQRECRINEAMGTKLPRPTITSLTFKEGNSEWDALNDE